MLRPNQIRVRGSLCPPFAFLAYHVSLCALLLPSFLPSFLLFHILSVILPFQLIPRGQVRKEFCTVFVSLV